MASDIAVVALPTEHQKVWDVSSEDVPHMTLLYLGQPDWDEEQLVHLLEFVQHAAGFLSRFGMSVERRGKLGDKDADVLFFSSRYQKTLKDFRQSLLGDNDIRAAYNAVDQFPEWTPHLTLGYPEDPAKTDEFNDHLHWVDFDRVAVWLGDSNGPTFELKSPDYMMDVAAMSNLVGESITLDILEHHGVKGMKWGVRKDRGHEGQRAKTKKIAKLDRKFAQKSQDPRTTIKIYNGAVKGMNEDIARINKKYTGLDATRDTPRRRAYHRELQRSMVDRLEASAESLGTNASGTQRYGISENGNSWDVVIREVRHAEGEEIVLRLTPKRNAKGLITGFEFSTQDMQQSSMVEDLLSEFGSRVIASES